MASLSDFDLDWNDYKHEFATAALVNNENVTIYTRKSLLPRKCYLSGKKLWMKEAVKLKRKVPLTAARVTETYWMDSREYMLFVLRNAK